MAEYLNYKIQCGDTLIQKRIINNEKNLAIAKKEAYKGEYGILNIGLPSKPAGSVARTLLWQNTAEDIGWTQFAKKTIYISDLVDYDGIEIVFISGTLDLNVKSTGLIPFNKKAPSNSQYFVLDTIEGEPGSTAYVHRRTGSVTAVNVGSAYAGVSFGDNQRCALDGSKMSAYNFGCIPYQIYGIKGIT